MGTGYIDADNVMQGNAYDAERECVRMLRLGGASVEQIFAETNLAEEKIRVYLKELCLPESGSCFFGKGAAALEHWYRTGCKGDPGVNLCPQCGKVIQRSVGGRSRRFCSDRCRNAYWNEKKKENGKPTVCKNCGQEFFPRLGKKAKYCSRKCYMEARYGRE